MKLLFASHNLGKLKEARSILAGLKVELLSIEQANQNTNLDLNELGVAETKDTFKGNALLKARVFAEASLFITIADDSGLAVDALDGFPGVRSARWLDGSDEERNQALLNKLKDQTNRSAKFVTAVCVYDPGLNSKKNCSQQNCSACFEGEVLGTIADQPLGREGFGYDPIFIPHEHTKTFAEMGVESKNKLSHRRLAFSKLKNYLQDKYNL